MTSPSFDEIEEKPLDPAIERVRRRMMRLMLVSIGIMMIGLMAVLFGIVYKLSSSGTSAPAGSHMEFDALITLAPGSRVVSTALEGGQLVVLVEDEAGRQSILLLDPVTGRQAGRFTFTTP